MEFVDPVYFISQAKPGLAIYGRWKESPGDPYETGFFIQEERKYISKISKSPRIRIKAALMVYNEVPLVVVLILIEDNFDMLYEIYFNYYQTGGGKQYFEDLASQDRIVLFFYEGIEKKRSFSFDNGAKSAFRGFMTEIMRYPKWSMSQFDLARQLLYYDYPTPDFLWRKLKQDFFIFN